MMDLLIGKCVILKNLPVTASEEDVRKCLELQHLSDAFHDIERYTVNDTDVRWIILFNTAEDAMKCLHTKAWAYQNGDERALITPEICVENLLPDRWLEQMQESIISETANIESEYVPMQSFRLSVLMASDLDDNFEIDIGESGSESVISTQVTFTGFQVGMANEEMKTFFESKSRSGGGDIVAFELNHYRNVVTVEFKNHNDANEVLLKANKEGGILYNGMMLKASPFIEPIIDTSKVFVSGMSDKTSDELATLFMEAKWNIVPKKLVRGKLPGTALVEFNSHPDITKLKSICEKNACAEAFLERKPGRGAVQDAERVVKEDRTHVLDNCKLTVALYYPCLDRDPSEEIAILEPVLIDDLDQYRAKFLFESDTQKAKIEASLKDVFGRPVLDKSSNLLQIECYVNPKDSLSRSFISNWKERCRERISWIFEELKVDETNVVASELFEQMKIKLQSVKVRRPEALAIVLERKSSGIVIVGEAKEVDELSKDIAKLIRELENELAKKNETATKILKFKNYEYILLQACNISSRVQTEFVQITMDGETKQITLSGRFQDVTNALSIVQDTLINFVRTEVTGFTQLSIDLMFKNQTRNILEKALYKKKLIGVWDFEKRTTLYMYSSNENDLQKCLQVLRETVSEWHRKLSEDDQAVLCSSQGTDFLHQLETKHEGLVKFALKGQELHVASVAEVMGSIQKELESFITANSEACEIIEIEAGKFQFIFTYTKDELIRIEEQYIKRLKVFCTTIDEPTKKGFMFQGPQSAVKATITKIQTLVDNVVLKDVVVTTPGFDEFIERKSGKRALKEIQDKRQCILRYGLFKANIENPDLGDDTTFGDTDSIGSCKLSVVVQDITRMRSDANYAIVNPCSTDLSNSLGLGDLLIKKERGEFTTTIGNVSLKIIQEDLVKQTTGGIVNSTLDELDLSKGLVSKAILQAAGQAIQQECWSDANKQRIQTEGIVVTGPGKLMCQKIIHLKARSSASGWIESLSKCLQEVDKLGLNSVALPALGTGGKGLSPDTMAKTMYQAVKQYVENNKGAGSLTSVRIVLFNSDLVDQFTSTIRNLADPTQSMKSFFSLPWKQLKTPTVTIYIYAKSAHNAQQAASDIQEVYDTRKIGIPKTFRKSHLDSLKQRADVLDVNLHVGADYIVIQGLKSKLDDMKEAVDICIANIDRNVKTLAAMKSIHLPPSWNMRFGEVWPQVVMLKPFEQEYTTLAQRFCSETLVSMQTIVSIERIQNPTLYMQYYGKKKEMETANKGSQHPIERRLWHGLQSADAAKNINQKGFNRNVYSVNARTSLRYCWADATGSRRVYCADVLTGDFCPGIGRITKPPSRNDPFNPTRCFDSTTDNLAAPDLFCIFHDAQAYPSFLITFG